MNHLRSGTCRNGLPADGAIPYGATAGSSRPSGHGPGLSEWHSAVVCLLGGVGSTEKSVVLVCALGKIRVADRPDAVHQSIIANAVAMRNVGLGIETPGVGGRISPASAPHSGNASRRPFCWRKHVLSRQGAITRAPMRDLKVPELRQFLKKARRPDNASEKAGLDPRLALRAEKVMRTPRGLCARTSCDGLRRGRGCPNNVGECWSQATPP